MPRRTVLTNRQRASLFDLPSDEAVLVEHYVLSAEDLAHVRRRRRPQNRLGFALQLCAFRYPGRLIQPGEVIPEAMLSFIGGQLGVTSTTLLDYGAREATRYQHSAALQRIYGYLPFEGGVREEMRTWLIKAAECSRSNDDLAASMLGELRRRKVIAPAPSTVERLCADALVAAERIIATRIASRLDSGLRERLTTLLSDTAPPETITRFVWLRAHEPGSNSNVANRLLDQLDWIRKLGVSARVLDDVPPHRVARLRRQGERYYADGLRDLPEARRLAILAVCAVEWRVAIVDALIETHDRIAGKTWKAAERRAEARALTGKLGAEPLDFITDGYARLRRYTPRLLRSLDLKGGRNAAPLLEAVSALKAFNMAADTGTRADLPVRFLRPKWRGRVVGKDGINRRLWETALLFAIRDGLRSGDLWVEESRRHRALLDALVPARTVSATGRLAVPLDPNEWIARRQSALDDAFQKAGETARRGGLPTGVIENGVLRLERLRRVQPEGSEAMSLDLYRRMPPARITDIVLQADDAIGFSEAFTDLRTGAPCRDRIGVPSVVLADGINIGLSKMAAATGAHSFWELMRIARWHIEAENYARALAMVVEAQAALPMARFWGIGETASSDGQFFSAGGAGEAINLVNARYGSQAGLKAYSHLSDQFAPFAVQTIPATVSEAPYILDGLLMTDAGRRVREHYADTGGFTDHVFALCAILGFDFAPRIRDLPSKRFYAFDPKTAHATLQPMIAGKIRQELIVRNWPDILRLAASAAGGIIAPSQLLRKLAAYSPQNHLALALREVGRVERTLFMLRWITDAALQHRAQLGLNKGEAHHALKRAIALGRRGQIDDRTTEGQHYRVAGLNLLAAIIIYWNTAQLGRIVTGMSSSGVAPDPALLAHVSPLGWEHIHLTGEYRWPA